MPLQAKPIYYKLEDPLSENTYDNRRLPALDIKGSKYKARYTSFEKIVFDGIVHFDECDLSIGLSFEDCIFNEPLVFINIKADGFDLMLNPDSQSLVFKRCNFKSTVIFGGKKSSIDRAIYFEDCTFAQGLEIEAINIISEGLGLRNCTLEKKLDLFNINLKQNLSLSGNTVNAETRIESLKASMLTFVEENIFNDYILIRHSKLDNGIAFYNGIFKKEISITHILGKKPTLSIIGSTFERSVSIRYHIDSFKPSSGFKSFHLRGAKFNDGIYVDGIEDPFAEIPFTEEIELNVSAELKGNIVFRNLHVGVLFIHGLNTSANIIFESLLINQIRIKKFINNAGLVFSTIKASHEIWHTNKQVVRENALYIDSSNFGKAQFYQVDFNSFDKIVFHNNILTDISTSLTKWFTPDQLDREDNALLAFKQAKKSKDKWRIISNRDSLISAYRSLQEIYRQLKFASQKQGDITQSLEFQRHEMNYYRKVIKIRKPRKWNEHFILWTNQTNDFGQNWIKALGFLLLCSFIIYIPIGFFTSDKLDYASPASSFSDVLVSLKVILCDNLKNWLVILNPTHRMTDLNENIDHYSKWIYLLDLLSRIIVSYFIFQIISAFRKLNK